MAQSTRHGFTLLELLVVVSVISILAGFLLGNFSDSSASTRDAKRKADLQELKNAVERYKSKYGQYPEQCPATGASSNGWSGQLGTDFQCDDGTGAYIRGVAPEFIRVLPVDSRSVSGQQGYVYTTNANRTVYKIMALNVVESESVDYLHPFARCAVGNPAFTWNQRFTRDKAWCAIRAGTGVGNQVPPAQCNLNDAVQGPIFRRTYAVWGGIDPETINRIENGYGTCTDRPYNRSTMQGSTQTGDDVTQRCAYELPFDTTQIICK